MNKFLRITALLTLAALPAAAASFTMNNTGTGTEGVADPNWVLSGGTAFVTATRPTLWLANDGTSKWISPQANYPANDDAGEYIYSTTFDLTGLDHNTAEFSFRVAVDNVLTDVRLNGVLQTITSSGLDAWSGLFTINSDFIGGENTLEFLTSNTVTSPTGLRVEFSAATADEISDVPEPGSIALLGFGTILLFSRRFRRAK